MILFKVYYCDRSATVPNEKGQVAVMLKAITKDFDNEPRCLCTIQRKHATKEVLEAIQSAFNIGNEMVLQQLNNLMWNRTLEVNVNEIKLRDM